MNKLEAMWLFGDLVKDNQPHRPEKGNTDDALSAGTKRQRQYARKFRKATRQDCACYDWEYEFLPPETPPTSFPKDAPFPKDFLEFYDIAWQWALERFRPNRTKPWPLPPLMLSRRMTKTYGRIDFGGESGRVLGILLARHGVRRCILLHEMAHLLSPIGSHHCPIFCRTALDLYVKFLGVDEGHALALAPKYGVVVATPAELAERRAAKDAALSENQEATPAEL